MTEKSKRAIFDPGKIGSNPPKPEKILNDKDNVTEDNIEDFMGVNDPEVIQIGESEPDYDDGKDMTGVVLLSGGLDSVAALGWAVNNGLKVHALIMDYGGSNNKREMKAAKKMARHYKVPFQVVKIDVPMWNTGLVNKNPDIYCDAKSEVDDEHKIAGEYVPARNTIFLSYAYAYAECFDLDSIIVGFNAGATEEDKELVGFGYMPDTSPVFCRAFQYVINTSTSRDKYTIALLSPFLRSTKAEIVEYCEENNVPLNHSYSCFKGDEDSCGICRACVARLRAFEEAGYTDPVEYQDREYYKSFRKD